MEHLDYLIDFKKDSPGVIIVFSSFSVVQYFEFKGFMQRSFPSYSILFLRDSRRSWYLRGIRGLSNSPEETVKALKAIIDEHHFKKVYTLGMCSGGYASILYGHLLAANRVFSFSPQTILDGSIPSRYTRLWARTYSDFRDHPYIDLRHLNLSRDAIDIFFDPQHPKDSKHVQSLTSKWPAPNLFEITGHHFVARVMRDSGQLKQHLGLYLEGQTLSPR